MNCWADDLSHGWWVSLLDGLRYRLSPEKKAPLGADFQPIAAYGANSWLQLLDWSSLLDNTENVSTRCSGGNSADCRRRYWSRPMATAAPAAGVPLAQELWAAQMQFKRDLSRSRFRQKIWVTLVAAEAIFLLTYIFNFKF